MFIGISSQLRRTMLREALREYISGINAKTVADEMSNSNSFLSTDQARALAERLIDARKLLREIDASENLLKQPATQEVPPAE